MRIHHKICKLWIVLLLLQYLACTSSSYINDPEKQKKRVNILIHKILADPEDIDALQELGIILIKTQRYDRGRRLLAKSYQLNPKDPKTSFYYALSLESCNREKQAFNVYRDYINISSGSPYRRLMKARYDYLSQKVMRQEAKTRLAQEELLQTRALAPKTIAVLPFHYLGTHTDYAPLGRGLSEMVITDLSQISGIQLVERLRLQAMMDEMKLTQTGLVDAKTAPRCGRLLSAGQVIYGAYDVLGENRFKVDVEFHDLINHPSPLKASSSGALKNLFHLEKRIVFSVITKMGIELTQQERERILRLPTRNFQAFVSYCKGLEKQDAGQFEAAAASFQEAFNLDPGFSRAENKVQESQSTAEVSGTTESVLASVEKIEALPESTPSTENLVNNRLQNLSDNIGANIIPGQDSRETSEEASGAGADVGLADLPDPPGPP